MAKKKRKIKKRILKRKKERKISPVEQIEAEKPEVEKVKKTKIRVVGIGGGGGNIVSELAQKLKKASFMAANTDLKALKEVSRKVERFSFGEGITHGLGTGMNPELGEMAAQNEKEKIKKILKSQDLVILIASLGGGVGSGASPVFAQISKNLGNLTYGIFTLPFKFEGEKKMEIARSSLEKIKPKLNALTIIPNERIFQIIDKATPLKSALSAINKKLSESLEGLIETIYEPGLINIDFADLRAILEGRGRLAYLNTLLIPKKEGLKKEGVEKLLNSPLYPYGTQGAKGVLYNIAGQKELSLEEVSQISKTISEKVNKEAKIIFGISQGKKYGDNIKTTVFATGLSMKNFLAKPKKLKLRKKIVAPPKKPTQKLKKVKKDKKTPKDPALFTKRAGPMEQVKKKKKIKPKKLRTPPPPSRRGRPLVKIKVVKKPAIKVKSPIEAEVKKENPPALEIKIRKNALQIKKEAEDEEREMLEKEKFWETPTFLRKKRFFI